MKIVNWTITKFNGKRLAWHMFLFVFHLFAFACRRRTKTVHCEVMPTRKTWKPTE